MTSNRPNILPLPFASPVPQPPTYLDLNQNNRVSHKTGSKIAVLGGNGKTGRHVIDQALERGHDVRVITKEPQRMDDLEHNRLNIIQGDVLNSHDLSIFFIGCDAVVSVIDIDFPPFITVKYYSRSMESIVQAMRTANITRLICLSAWFVHESPQESFFHRWFYRPFVIGRTLDDMAKMEDYLKTSCSDINYTVVRTPKLDDSEYQRATVVCKQALRISSVSEDMPRANLAKYMLDILTDNLTYGKMIAIGLIPHHSQTPSTPSPSKDITNNIHNNTKTP